jgi:hypothetical protein
MTVSVKWYGDKVSRNARQGAARGLFLGAEHVLEQAIRVVPIEEHTLEGSGIPSIDEGQLRAAVSFDTPYAVRQHEEMDYRHDPGRTAKYLETPLHRERSVVLKLIREAIKKELG